MEKLAYVLDSTCAPKAILLAQSSVGRDAAQNTAAQVPVGNRSQQSLPLVDANAELFSMGTEPLDQGVY